MDSLISRADAIQPLHKKRKTSHKPSNSRPKSKPNDSSSKTSQTDPTLSSIASHTLLPKSLRTSSPPPPSTKTYNHIPNKKLRSELTKTSANALRAKALVKDAQELLLVDEPGKMEVEGEMERTWRVGQEEIVQSVGGEAAKGRKELKLDGGSYRTRYTRNGRHLAIVGKKGHVATFDWQTGNLHTELHLQETCRDITFLHSHSHFAVAQSKYVFIYDKDGVELHKLKDHIEPTRLEFLPYHWLLASVGNAGYLKYLDTSTGQLLTQYRTALGPCTTMTQNPHNAVIHLGHTNGTVTLWTPNLPHPAVKLLAHLGPVTSISVDPSGGGRYMATAGADGMVKVWDCRNWKGAVRGWSVRGGSSGGTGIEVEWSQRGYLGVVSGGSVNVYPPAAIHTPHSNPTLPPLYLTHPIPHRPLTSARFAPFQDILTIGHAGGVSSILVPGAGEANFDSGEADPFEGRKARREREVRGLLDKIQPDMISLNPDFVGSLAPPSKLTTATDATLASQSKSKAGEVPYARLPRLERLRVSGKADETELHDSDEEEGEEESEKGKGMSKAEKEKKKMRGKNKSLKRYLRKQRKNVIDPRAVAVRKKLEHQKVERQKAKEIASGVREVEKPSALDRFKRAEK
ncbi:hypothetical protein JAAARDRAFT_133961 [Jaapia argillacea MUCL 33604]|uniref:U three protein 7 n=1 Tax=Jaapia argillacea MUCL 33604 TaxID=933084 RepID=A0A067PW38_9AGAM|nr:hypothetical protein JAAARDRAFT_133961 [Jaapia argillacea MUCL 33604]